MRRDLIVAILQIERLNLLKQLLWNQNHTPVILNGIKVQLSQT